MKSLDVDSIPTAPDPWPISTLAVWNRQGQTSTTPYFGLNQYLQRSWVFLQRCFMITAHGKQFLNSADFTDFLRARQGSALDAR